MRFKKSFELIVISLSQPLLWLIIVLIATFPLLIYRLGNLVPAFSASEKIAIGVSSRLSHVTSNPFFAPHQLAQFVLRHGPGTLYFKQRLVSAAFGFVFALLFYYVVRNWHTRRVAILSSILFVSSSWFLHFARLATPEIMYVSLLVGLAYGAWLETTTKRQLPVIAGAVVVAYLLYIPGFVWFVLGALIWQKNRLRRRIKIAPLATGIAAALFLVLISPLVLAFIKDATLVKEFIGWNSNSSLMSAVRALAQIPYYLTLRGPSDPTIWIARLPLLDIFTLVMAALGAFTYFYRARLDRTRVLASSLVVSVLLVALGGTDKIIVLLPLIYLLVAAGIAFMLQRWFTVFPKNPLARSIGVLVVILAIAASVFYQTRQYFVAWPARAATKSAFNQRP